jgi:enoyl-CoA hydratase/carnithine racemase
MSDGTIRLERDGRVGVIVIDRPDKLNAITVAMDHQMNELRREVNGDDSIGAVVLTGAGDRAFTAGSDINDLEGYGNNWQYRNRFERDEDYVWALWRIRKPVVAAIAGYAIGGGMELACASDIRLATPDSSFACAEIRWGWHGGSGSTQLLTRAVGPGHANRLLMTGEPIGGEEALRIGLVQELLPREDLMVRALSLAGTIASRAPIAVQSTKNLVRVAQSSSIDVGWSYENDMFAYCMLTEDAAEGRRAFAERRDPAFKGR